jgi:Holliday junction DNA helicase RuvA
MISFLQGEIILKKEKFIVLDVNGVGYKVFLSQKAISKLPEIGKNLKLFCFLNIGENKLELYGFLDQKELELFQTLDSIRGVGPKAALEISSLGSLEKIKGRILSQDASLFEKIPGIGKKKAMAIILELTGKIKEVSKKKEAKIDEAEESLVSLGFPRQKAREALKKIPKDIEDTDQRIKEALKILGS